MKSTLFEKEEEQQQKYIHKIISQTKIERHGERMALPKK